MKITVELSGDLQRALTRARRETDNVSDDALDRIADEWVDAAQVLAGGGRYGRSMKSNGVSGRAVEAGSDSPMASILERGRRPGKAPPAQSIRKRSGGSYQAAQRAADRIAQRGTNGRWTVKKANAQIRNDGTIERIARAALADMASLGRTDGSI